MDTTTLAWKLFETLSPLALLGLIWCAVVAAHLCAARTKSAHFTRVLQLLDNVVLAAAQQVQQVLVDKLKAASLDGRLSVEQGADAKQAALTSARSQLGPRGLADVGTTLGLKPGEVDRMLGARIEAAVHRLKTPSRVSADHGTAGDAVPFAA
jgi:hypothetical protein